MTETYNRNKLSDEIYKQIGLSFSDSDKIVTLIFENLQKGLIMDNVVKIPLFGSFYVRHKKERIGRNPKTQEEVAVSARKVVSFYASKQLKNAINENK